MESTNSKPLVRCAACNGSGCQAYDGDAITCEACLGIGSIAAELAMEHAVPEWETCGLEPIYSKDGFIEYSIRNQQDT